MEDITPSVEAQFYSSEELCLGQLVENDSVFSSLLSIKPGKWSIERAHFYQIDDICSAIDGNGYQQVALQFPDSMLPDSAAVSDAIERRTGRKPFILADTSYGSCCLDEVAAEHGQADFLVHFGYACLSSSRGLIPTKLVLPRLDLTDDDFSNLCTQLYPLINSRKDYRRFILICDIPYHDCCDSIKDAWDTYLASIGGPSSSVTICRSSVVQQEGPVNPRDCAVRVGCAEAETSITIVNRAVCVPSYWLENDLAGVCFIFIGSPDSPLLTHLIMGYPQATGHFSYFPTEGVLRLEDRNVNRLLRKRLFLVEKAKDARLIGILVGTLGVAYYLQILDRVKKCCKAAGKRYYVFSLGKLNVPKLANFAEIDIFVQISCPFQVVLDSSDYHRPLITPFEFEVACGRGEWMAGPGWNASFKPLLENDLSEKSNSESRNDPDVSLITGQIRYLQTTETDPSTTGEKTVLARDEALQMQAYSAGEAFGGRSWKGLEKNLEESEPSELEEGRSGIASGYANEPYP